MSKFSANVMDRERDKFRETVSGETAVAVVQDAYIKVKIVDNFSPSLIFTGEALIDPADISQPIWRIKQEKTVGTETTTDYAGIGLFDQVWENRFTLFPYENTFSLNFNGVDQYASIPNAANIDFLDSTAFSLSTWVKMGVTGGTKAFIIKGAGSSVGNNTISLYLPSNERLSFLIRATGAGDRLRVRTPALNIDDNNWHNIVVTYDGLKAATTSVAIYFDGVSQTISTQNDTLVGPLVGGDDWKFATAGNATGSFLAGNMDEPALWDRVLTQLEVTEMYNGGVAKNLLEHSAAANMISCWTFNDKGNFPITKDRADSNDATLFNMSDTNYDGDTP